MSVRMPPRPCVQIPEWIQDYPEFDTALEEVTKCIPPEVIDRVTALWLEDVRSLMLLCWMRGVAWERQRCDAQCRAELELEAGGVPTDDPPAS